MPNDKQSKRAKLEDVAALAGTSTATASRALSGKGPVSPETRRRVLAATEQLNYRPNLYARSLRQQSGFNIGLVIPNLLNPYYIALADEISQLLAGSGYYLLLSATRDDPGIEQGVLYDLIGHINGLFWVPTGPDKDLLDHLHDQHIPTVSLVRRLPGDLTDTVVFEDFNGSYTATEYLIKLGHCRIGYIGGDIKHSSNQARRQGYLKAMQDAGIPVGEEMVKPGPPQSTWGEVATIELLRLPAPPTAIFVGSNAIMPGVLRILRQYQVTVPDQMSLICFDDLDWFFFSVPSITAISISPAKLAKTALDLLMRRIKDSSEIEKPPVFIEVNFELVLRNSATPPQSENQVVSVGSLLDEA
jgi:LacI family transcriptional regulator